eukprot:16442954-Heterocapsa_arctica.AAC.1
MERRMVRAAAMKKAESNASERNRKKSCGSNRRDGFQPVNVDRARAKARAKAKAGGRDEDREQGGRLGGRVEGSQKR